MILPVFAFWSADLQVYEASAATTLLWSRTESHLWSSHHKTSHAPVRATATSLSTSPPWIFSNTTNSFLSSFPLFYWEEVQWTLFTALLSKAIRPFFLKRVTTIEAVNGKFSEWMIPERVIRSLLEILPYLLSLSWWYDCTICSLKTFW